MVEAWSKTTHALRESRAEEFLRSALGETRMDGLVQAMLDQGVPPIFLSHAEGGLRERLDQAETLVREVVDSLDRSSRAELESLADPVLRGRDLPGELVELGTSRRYFALPQSIFQPPREDSRVLSRLPQLVEFLDDDGLLRLDGLQATGDSVMVDGFAVPYHQLLRRGFGSGINADLVSTLIRAGSVDGNEVRIAIDERRLASQAEHWSIFEKDYLRGPPLTPERLDDRNEVGVTVHWYPDRTTLLEPYSSLQVAWRMQDENLKVLQMEELVDIDHHRVTFAENDLVPVRYLHAIRDIDAGTFVHCDGAVRTYRRHEYEARSDGRFPPETPAAHRRKVFRIDGRIDTSDWSDITARWFRHNELALEYLSSLGDSRPSDPG